MTSSKFLALALLSATLAVAGCRTAPVTNIQDQTYGVSAASSPKKLSLADYEKAIIRAGLRRRWTFERIDAGHLEGTVQVRGKHTAVVDVMFDQQDFSITYKRSSNLNYDPASGTIHPNFNSWIGNLKNDIISEVQTARAS